MNTIVSKLATTLNITEEQAQKMITTEQKRKEASVRYRQSEAYKLRLQQQKLVRKALKEVEL
jgi:hypothetical protein